MVLVVGLLLLVLAVLVLVLAVLVVLVVMAVVQEGVVVGSCLISVLSRPRVLQLSDLVP